MDSSDDFLYAAPSAPPCSRYEGGENDQRLLAVWTYVVGLAGGTECAALMKWDIARIHDHKGQLVVATKRPLGRVVEHFFRTAWKVVGHEPEENVEFLGADSTGWEDYWAGRRFNSDWEP